MDKLSTFPAREFSLKGLYSRIPILVPETPRAVFSRASIISDSIPSGLDMGLGLSFLVISVSLMTASLDTELWNVAVRSGD